jgi:hypothetical protein
MRDLNLRLRVTRDNPTVLKMAIDKKEASLIIDMYEALTLLLEADRMECKPGSDDELRKIGAQVNAENLAEIVLKRMKG